MHCSVVHKVVDLLHQLVWVSIRFRAVIGLGFVTDIHVARQQCIMDVAWYTLGTERFCMQPLPKLKQ